MNDPAFSVIVPVYNTEAYLCRCVDSILNQSFDDFELILVNDGSTDKSGAICDEYAGKSDKVKVIHRQNGGICAARNAGLQTAQGKYIAFCDSDDYWTPFFLEKLVGLFRHKNVGLAICGFQSVNHAGIPVNGRCSVDRKEDDRILTINNDMFWSLFNDKRIGSCWDKAYISEIIRISGLRFDENITSVEDTDFVVRYISSLEPERRVAVTDDRLYMYQTTEHTSLVHSYDPQKWLMFQHLFRRLEYFVSTDSDRTSLYRYVVSAITYTINSIFRYKPKISLSEFNNITDSMLRSDYYKNAFIHCKHCLSEHGKMFAEVLQSGNAFLIWGYYMVSKLLKTVFGR